MIRPIALAVALSCAAFASPAIASDEPVQVQGKVSYVGLDLDDPSGAVEFDKRVAREARRICRRGVPSEFQYGRVVNDCRASVMADGQHQFASLLEKNGADRRMAAGD